VGLKQRDSQVGCSISFSIISENSPRGANGGGGGEKIGVICICVHEQMGGGRVRLFEYRYRRGLKIEKRESL
jgi:hypothetical protein